MDPASPDPWLSRIAHAVEGFLSWVLREPPRLEASEVSLTAAHLQAAREGAARIAEIVRERTPEAAREAVEVLETLPAYDAPSWRAVAALSLECGAPELSLSLQRLARRVPEGAHVLWVPIETLSLHLAARNIAEVLGADVDVGSRTSRSITLRGERQGLMYTLRVGPNLMKLSLEAPQLEWRAAFFDEIPSEAPDDVSLLATLHPAIRGPAAKLLRRVANFGLKTGALALQATRRPPSRVEALVDLAATVVVAAQALPATDHERLEEAYLAEDEPAWRLAFARARLSLKRRTEGDFLERLLADPFPEVRAVAAESLDHTPTWVALASQPGMSEAIVDRALHALRWELELPRAVAGALHAGVALDTPERRWVLERVVQVATPELEPVLLVALRGGGVQLQRQAVAALSEVGSVSAVPSLREVTERWAPGLARAAQEAIEAIREREGVSAGALSLVEVAGPVGALSTTERPEAGGLSETDGE